MNCGLLRKINLHGNCTGRNICRNSSPVAKKKIIFPDSHLPCSVLGLASNERIWKLCWILNQNLGLELKTESEGMSRLDDQEVYHDTNSDPDFEYQLFENNPKAFKGSKLVQQFRFLLVIRHRRELPPDLPGVLAKIRASDAISLVSDLSSEKDIQRVLP